MCSTPLTVVVNTRWNGAMMRPSIWSGESPVYCHTTLTTGISIAGKISVGVRSADNGPTIRIKMARTTNV